MFYLIIKNWIYINLYTLLKNWIIEILFNYKWSNKSKNAIKYIWGNISALLLLLFMSWVLWIQSRPPLVSSLSHFQLSISMSCLINIWEGIKHAVRDYILFWEASISQCGICVVTGGVYPYSYILLSSFWPFYLLKYECLIKSLTLAQKWYYTTIQTSLITFSSSLEIVHDFIPSIFSVVWLN